MVSLPKLSVNMKLVVLVGFVSFRADSKTHASPWPFRINVVHLLPGSFQEPFRLSESRIGNDFMIWFVSPCVKSAAGKGNCGPSLRTDTA